MVLELIKLQKVATVRHVQLLETVQDTIMHVIATTMLVIATTMLVVATTMLVMHIHIHVMLLEIDIVELIAVHVTLWLDHHV